MKADIQVLWDDAKRRPNVYFNLEPETEAERAAILALYSLRGKVKILTDGVMMIDFYPEGDKK